MSSLTTNGDNPDLRNLADLIRAGAPLGLEPHAGELPLDFAVRVARALEGHRKNRHWGLAARIAIGVTLAAFGITSF